MSRHSHRSRFRWTALISQSRQNSQHPYRSYFLVLSARKFGRYLYLTAYDGSYYRRTHDMLYNVPQSDCTRASAPILPEISMILHSVLLAACPNVVDMAVIARHCVHSSASSTSSHISPIRDPGPSTSPEQPRYPVAESRSATIQLLRWLTCRSLRELVGFDPGLKNLKGTPAPKRNAYPRQS